MEYLTLMRNKKKIIAIITCLIIALSLGLSLLHPLEYGASTRVLVVQPIDSNLDSYSAIKSGERISEKLSEVIYTTSFYNKVMESDFDIDKSYFKIVERKRRKQWQKMIDTQVLRGAGMLKVVVYHTSKVQAKNLSQAITSVLNTSGWEYIGNVNIQIKEVDSPLVSQWPVRPNFVINGLIGLILGLVVSILYILITSSQFTFSRLVTRAGRAIKTIDGENHQVSEGDIELDRKIAQEVGYKPNIEENEQPQSGVRVHSIDLGNNDRF